MFPPSDWIKLFRKTLQLLYMSAIIVSQSMVSLQKVENSSKITSMNFVLFLVHFVGHHDIFVAKLETNKCL